MISFIKKILLFQVPILIFLIGLVAIFAVFFADFGLPGSDRNFVGKTQKVTLSPGNPVMQTFTASRDGLNQVRVVLGNTSDLDWNDQISFELADDTCLQTIARGEFTPFNRKPKIFFPFAFPAIPDSAEKTYCFKITYSGTDRKDGKPYVAATDKPDERFAGVSFTNTGKGKTYPNQTLKIRPAYTSGSWSGDLSLLLGRLSQYKPDFFKGWPIALLGIGTIIGSTLLVLLLARGTESPRKSS